MKLELQLALDVIALFREYAAHGTADKENLAETHRKLACALDRCKVNNQSTELLEELIDDVLYLKCDVIKDE